METLLGQQVEMPPRGARRAEKGEQNRVSKARVSAGSTEHRQATTLVQKNLCREAAYLNSKMERDARKSGARPSLWTLCDE
jgi:hypothetical protein